VNGDTVIEDKTGKYFPDFTSGSNGVNPIIEDKTGKFWFGTNGNTFIYDASLNDEVGQERTFTVFRDKEGNTVNNVWSILEDKKGNIWLGGNGLWRYDGSTFTNITQNFVGYIYEDRNGNIWTSAEENSKGSWALSRYDEKLLSSPFMTPTVIKSKEGMIFGILEANDGSIWFGTLSGVQHYDGKTITNFK